ncbi:MAG: M56 family metallopeptidase [Candidatus Sulfotelmatobacter sp.]|jgi:beta-lactamase regulating signal transducer with metallopeptidase domain
MTLIAALPASTSLLAQLANPAARALALSIVVGLGLSAFRVKSTSLRLFTWTAVLYASIAMPLLQWMLPPLPIPTPAILQQAFFQFAARRPVLKDVQATETRYAAPAPPAAGAPSIVYAEAAKPRLAPASGSATAREQTPLVAPAPASSPSFPFSIGWTAIAVYFAVAFILLMRFFVGLAFSHRLMQASQRIDEPRLAPKLAARARAAGLAIVPRAAESEFISVPLTMGILRSTILLPSGWREWDDAKLDAVIAHELSHVARRDALTQRLSLLHRAIFWFSPLAWWLDRQLADLAEQASDEAALSCGANRENYARTLLGFFEALQTAPGRVWWQGVAMAKLGHAQRQAEHQAEQRVERILSWKGAVTMGRKKSIAVVVLALAVPVIYFAASAHPVEAYPRAAELMQAQSSTSAPAATSKPAPSPAPNSQSGTAILAPPVAGPSDGIISGGPTAPPMPPAPRTGVAGGVAGPAPIAPVAPIAPIGPIAQAAPAAPAPSSPRGFSYHYGYDDEQRFVIVSGKTDSVTMSGSAEDARHVEKLRKQIPGDFIWFQRDEKSYVIRDQATIDRAKQLWAPQEELGKKQEELGKQQEALGKQQQELGAKMEQIRVNVPDMTEELEKLKAELKQLSSGATSEQVGHVQSEIGELQRKIGEIQSHAGDQQGKLGEEMGALGEKQGKLGEQQGELGRQQGELAEQASRQMKQLLDEAIAKGTAQPEI